VEWEAALLPPSEHASSSSCIAGLEYVLELDAVMVALTSGDLLLIYTETKELEEVGSIQGGVACMAWSPDGELLALVSNSGNLLLMTKVRHTRHVMCSLTRSSQCYLHGPELMLCEPCNGTSKPSHCLPFLT
jgi:hypothetical protein